MAFSCEKTGWGWMSGTVNLYNVTRALDSPHMWNALASLGRPAARGTHWRQHSPWIGCDTGDGTGGVVRGALAAGRVRVLVWM